MGHLVLGRKIGESICVGEDILVTVERIAPDHVRLGVSAPDDVRIDRQEIRVSKDRGLRPPPREATP